jgi:hypothetical protein
MRTGRRVWMVRIVEPRSCRGRVFETERKKGQAVMEDLSKRYEDSDDFDFGDDLFDDELFDPEDLPFPIKEQREIDEYLEKKVKKRRQKTRRKEKHGKHNDSWEE